MTSREPIAGLPLWPVPLVAGLLPAIAALFALAMYQDPRGSTCNPFIEDCVSISRMAKYGLQNQVFRALVLPGAVFQALTWFVAAYTFSRAGLTQRVPVLLGLAGICAGVALLVYGSFLGTDGEPYRWLRRRGTLIYFGSTYLAALAFARGAQQLRASGQLALPRGHRIAQLALLGFITLLFLVHGLASVGGLTEFENRIENMTEWWVSLALTLLFGVVASLWWRWRLKFQLTFRRLDDRE